MMSVFRLSKINGTNKTELVLKKKFVRVSTKHKKMKQILYSFDKFNGPFIIRYSFDY